MGEKEKSFSASYAAAGVDITAGYKSVELMKMVVAGLKSRNEGGRVVSLDEIEV